jgi:hypothetical protein
VSTVVIGLVPTRDQPQLLSRKRPVDGTLGSRYSLRLGHSLARHAMVRVEGDRPFPYVPPDALNDQVFDVSMSHIALS